MESLEEIVEVSVTGRDEWVVGGEESVIGRGESVIVVREESTMGGEESGTDGREPSSPKSMTVSSPIIIIIVYITSEMLSIVYRIKNRGRLFTTYAYLRFPVQGSPRHH